MVDDPPPLPPPPFWRTPYFERAMMKAGRESVLADDIRAALERPGKSERQDDGRVRYWGWIAWRGRWLRVVTLADGKTVHNAFWDRSFKP